MSIVVKAQSKAVIAKELRALAAQNAGALLPEHVVDAARDETSPLHKYFEWEDSAAADAWRLMQARGLIARVKVQIMRQETPRDEVRTIQVREFKSLPSSRYAKKGYESISDILADPDKREELVEQARAEFRRLRQRYEGVTELAQVWSAVDEALPPARTIEGAATVAQ